VPASEGHGGAANAGAINGYAVRAIGRLIRRDFCFKRDDRVTAPWAKISTLSSGWRCCWNPGVRLMAREKKKDTMDARKQNNKKQGRDRATPLLTANGHGMPIQGRSNSFALLVPNSIWERNLFRNSFLDTSREANCVCKKSAFPTWVWERGTQVLGGHRPAATGSQEVFMGWSIGISIMRAVCGGDGG